MPYTDNIPQSGQTLGQTQAAVNTNFTIIRTVQQVNHEDFDNANEGKHKFLQMPEQVSAPTTAANEAGFYSKVGTNPAETNLFFRAEGSGFEYQMTSAISASTGRFGSTSATSPNGWTFLPGGLIYQWGVTSASSSSSVLVTLATSNIDFPTGILNVQLTPTRATSSPGSTFGFWVSTSDYTNTTFRIVNQSGHSYAFFWTAIGY